MFLLFATMCTKLTLTLMSYPSRVLYPLTPSKPIPIPTKYPYPYVGWQVLKGKGQGQPKMTLGLPMLITNDAK